MKIANIDREIIYIFWKTTRGEEGGGGVKLKIKIEVNFLSSSWIGTGGVTLQ